MNTSDNTAFILKGMRHIFIFSLFLSKILNRGNTAYSGWGIVNGICDTFRMRDLNLFRIFNW